MKSVKYIIPVLLICFFSCKKDDDNKNDEVEVRDPEEVYAEDLSDIETYLDTHFMEVITEPTTERYPTIVFDTIGGENSDKTPIAQSGFLDFKMVEYGGISHKLYFLKYKGGAETEYQPTFADYAVATYRGQLLDDTTFDESVSPARMDLPGFIKGFTEGLTEFRGATEYETQDNGEVTFSDDYGIGAVFIPSTLAYFNDNTKPSIPPYSPLIFSFQVYKGIQADHDGDGIPSYLEDLNGNGLLNDDNTDGDKENSNQKIPNYLDADDDGDGTPTADEIEVNDANGDGLITQDEITFPDTNGNGTPDYLDPGVR